MAVIYVFIGGGIGALARFGMGKLLSSYSASFPMATFLSNAMSCIILGIMIAAISQKSLPHSYQLLLMTGFCGGFSTFSTFSGETFILLQNGQLSAALFYTLTSVLVCLLCIWCGIVMGQFALRSFF